MSNDITALALIAKIKKQTESFDTVVLQEGEANALVEALEKAQQKGAEQGRHACALFDEVVAQRQRIAEMEAENNRQVLEVMRLSSLVAELESRTVTVKLYDDFQLCHYGTTEDYAKGYIDSQNNFIKWLAAAGIKVKGE
ncbi:hypothetical protein ACEVFK_001481 [Salmonella enterica]